MFTGVSLLAPILVAQIPELIVGAVVEIEAPEKVAAWADVLGSRGPGEGTLAKCAVAIGVAVGSDRVNVGSIGIERGLDLVAVVVDADKVGTIRKVRRDVNTLGQGGDGHSGEGEQGSELHCGRVKGFVGGDL